ncbi:MAG: DNA topoisomerase [Lachnospiraceae bacterium]|nr:DNA topoisomerase [Lachnospiraceae bacterium]MDD7148427.1 DNA topoisomerase [Lachnospiraceae bacterium]MDY4068547.1 DNA topoisomerase [Lachnospiraceae bacterium]
MGKSLFIAEKPSVAREFAKALGYRLANRDGYMESEEALVTWCVGHLVTMSYPEKYDEKYKRWSFDTLPFVPKEFKYEVIDSVKKQFQIVSGLLNRQDVDVIYVCTDSGREGEYIYRLVEQQAGVTGKVRKRVWIDSQTEEEILRGIREAKDLSAYDNLCEAAYLRAKEDYLMGINFSRALTLGYGNSIRDYLKLDRAVISVGRVMTCVLGIVVKREREIREFVKTPFYRVTAQMLLGEREFEAEWRAAEGSRYFQSPLLYKENGFKQRETAEELIAYLTEQPSEAPVVDKLEKKKEMKNPPLLYNLAELQNDCSKYFKISPDETLRIAQELYEKKLTTYPRTDARVLSTAVSKEITKNLKGLCQYDLAGVYAGEVLETGMYGKLAKSRYVNDKQITDHYAIIPTGQGFSALRSLHPTAAQVYELIAKRFLSIFYPAAVYQKVSLTALVKGERFFSNFKVLTDEGYLRVAQCSFFKKKEPSEESQDEEIGCDASFLELLNSLKKGALLSEREYTVKEGETSPPKRYNSGTLILTMENAGQFIEDEELRAQIKGSGIGTSATRAEILKKLVNIKYLALNKKTQIITPTLLGELVYEVVYYSMRPMLNPSLTASWEKGLTQVAEGTITGEEYMSKLDDFVSRRTNLVKQSGNGRMLLGRYDIVAQNYKRSGKNGKTDSKKSV